jgi:uncharacterized protein YidB (DUF937 family)
MSLNLKNVAIAMLGLLAYKNRDKLGELMTGAADEAGKGGGLAGGLNDILDRFRNAGSSDSVDSWIGTGPNQPAQRDQIEKAIDPEMLKQLSAQTGLSEQELIDRLTKELPEAVDKLTPDGRVPSGDMATLLDSFPSSPRV